MAAISENPLMPLDPQLLFKPVNIALLTVNDSRASADDGSGDILAMRIAEAGHVLIAREDSRDDANTITAHLHRWIDDKNIDAIITIGGTGITPRDVMPEVLERVGDKTIPGFGELFRQLSYARIGTSAIQSRACAVAARGTYIFALPGSHGGVEDGWDRILADQLDSRHRPFNFAELMPRLRQR